MISRNRKKYNSQSPFSMSCMGPKPPMAENSGKLSGFPTIKPALSSLASATSVKKRLHEITHLAGWVRVHGRASEGIGRVECNLYEVLFTHQDFFVTFLPHYVVIWCLVHDVPLCLNRFKSCMVFNGLWRNVDIYNSYITKVLLLVGNYVKNND